VKRRAKVEVCDSCKGYVKAEPTVKHLAPWEIVLDDLATVPLEVAALDRGYHRPEAAGVRARSADCRGVMDLDRPAHVCRELLSAIEASEAVAKRRKRDTDADAIGPRRQTRLARAGRSPPIPKPMEFEAWLLETMPSRRRNSKAVCARWRFRSSRSGACSHDAEIHFATGWQQGHLRMTRALIR